MKLMKVPALPALCSDITDEMAIALAIGAVVTSLAHGFE